MLLIFKIPWCWMREPKEKKKKGKKEKRFKKNIALGKLIQKSPHVFMTQLLFLEQSQNKI